MAGSFSRTGSRAAALVLATGTLCAAAGVTAGAASASVATKDTVNDARTSSTAGTALHIAVNLPALGQIAEDISIVDGQIKRTTSTGALGSADLFRSSGPTAAIFNALNKQISVTLDGVRQASAALIPQTDVAGLLNVAAGTVNGLISPLTGPPAPNNPLSSLTSSKVTDLNVGLLGNAAGTQLQGLLGQLSTTVNGLVGQITTTLSQVTGQLGGTSAAPMLADLPAQLTSLQGSLADLAGPGGLAHIGLIAATQKILDDGTQVLANATSQVGDVKLLGSLVTVGALQSVSTASTNGQPGGAKASVSPKGSIADVKVGSLVDLQATINGLTGQLAGLALPLQTTLKSVLDPLNQLLGTLGVTIGDLDLVNGALPNKTSCDGKTSGTFAAADGSCAEAITKGIGIRLAPALPGLGAVTGATGVAASTAAPLLEIALVPSAASARGTHVVTPGLVAPQPRQLPRTGGNAALTAGLGAMLLAGAAFGWRRFRVLAR